MMRVPVPLVISLAAGACVCSVGALVMLDHHRARTAPPTLAEADLEITPFDLVDQDGQPRNESVLDGELTLVGFIFTNCPGLCPMMTMTMAEAQGRLADTPMRLASFSLDAERDTPEALRAFGVRFGADFRRWTFLTGDTETTRRIVREGLKLVVEDEQDNQVPTADGGTMANVLHPTRLMLVGPDRSILGFYSVSHVSELDRLELDVRSFFADRSSRGG
ncbi:MAG: SCO family protein [Phycisphaerales bacterium]